MKPGPTKNPALQKQAHVITEEREETLYNGSPVEIPSTHRYNNRSRKYHIHHVSTFKNPLSVFPKERTKETTLHQQVDHAIRINPKRDTIKVEPTAKHIHCDITGNIL